MLLLLKAGEVRECDHAVLLFFFEVVVLLYENKVYNYDNIVMFLIFLIVQNKMALFITHIRTI